MDVVICTPVPTFATRYAKTPEILAAKGGTISLFGSFAEMTVSSPFI